MARLALRNKHAYRRRRARCAPSIAAVHMSTEPAQATGASNLREAPYPSIRYAWYVVSILTLVYTFSFISRQILSLLIAPIRHDLGITDTEVSLLIGFSFALFYTFFGIPLGRLADVRSRRSIIAAGLAFWSLFSAGCGLARSFAQMLFLRMGVGVGEASLSPAAYSIITDYFPKELLATAISIYSMGIYLGSGMAFLLGGIVVRFASSKQAWVLPLFGTVRPWQLIFFAVGLPGLLVVPLLYTIREPVRRGALAHGPRPPMSQVFAYIFKNKGAFLSHNIGFGLLSLIAYSSAAWVPEFFRRVYHWEIPKIGLVYGSIIAVFGSFGIVPQAGWRTGCEDAMF